MTYKFENATVLVVDDMEPMVGILRGILHAFGFRYVLEAYSAEEAFRKFCKHNPDLVITDWNMGHETGVDFVKRIRSDKDSPNRLVPVIMTTGYTQQARVELARDKGITEFLAKPFTAEDLYRRIRHVIDCPRQFVEMEDYTGPDRRRKKGIEYDGAERRTPDQENDLEQANMLYNLRMLNRKSLVLED